MSDIKKLIVDLRHLGPAAIRAEIEHREAEIKALRTLLRAARHTSSAGRKAAEKIPAS